MGRSTADRASASRLPPDDEVFSRALAQAERGELDLAASQLLLKGTGRRDRSEQLFAAASRLRDERLGRQISLVAHIHMVTPCEVDPSCRYCSLSSTVRSVQAERTELSESALLRAVRYAEGRGVRSIVLVGGTSLRGSDELVRERVRAVRRITDIDLALDVGPSLSSETLEWLKDQNVRTIYCSVETTEPRAFRRAKPGDDLEARIAHDALVDRQGMALGNVVMNGLGTHEDLLRAILFLRRFPRLTYLYISTFHPVRGTPWARHRPASLRTSLRALALARFVFPGVHLGLAEVEVEDPGSVARVSSQLAAGGGNTLAAILVYAQQRVDNVDRIRREAAAAGFTVT